MNQTFRCAALLMMVMASACLQEASEAGTEQAPPQEEVASSELSSPLAVEVDGAQAKDDEETVQCEPFCCEWDFELNQCRWWAMCLPGGMISYCP